jgi:hypothetical protein
MLLRPAKLEQADEDNSHGFIRGDKKECQRRLDILRIDEQKWKGAISGLDVERKLILVARELGSERTSVP